MFRLSLLILFSVGFAAASLFPFHAGHPLNTARDAFCLVQFEQWVYAIGGYSGSLQLASVERTTRTVDGALDTWEVLSSHLVTPR